MQLIKLPLKSLTGIAAVVLLAAVLKAPAQALAPQPPNPQSGSVGVEGQINGAAPTQAATITLPANGQTFTSLPITISGLCPKGLLVEIFKNNVFGGSTECTTGSYSLQIDLFNGRNDLVARVYDALNQAGPDSNTVTVTFNSGSAQTGPRISVTSAFAKRGADPDTQLSWPISISGGSGPYAISVDWGDKSAQDLISQALPGDYTLTHTYSQSGIFNVTIKVSDATGATAFLQVVGIANGPIQQTSATKQNTTSTSSQRVVLWWPFLLTFILIIIAFWVGQKHQLEIIRDRLRRGERPFK